MDHQNLWNDAAFVKRVEIAAKNKGMDLQQVALAAGVSRFFFEKKAEGRLTNTVLILAQILDVSPVELFGLE